jgi:hypothetical protein
MTSTHVRIDDPLKAWMDDNRKPGDTMSDQVRKALIAQARFNAGERRQDTTVASRAEAQKQLQELLEV